MDQDRTNKQSETRRRSSMDPAEGSREDMRGSGSSSERTSGKSSERSRGSSSDSGGISNRERSREEREQSDLPERGSSKSEC